jgi:hypothetical protein
MLIRRGMVASGTQRSSPWRKMKSLDRRQIATIGDSYCRKIVLYVVQDTVMTSMIVVTYLVGTCHDRSEIIA